MSQRVTKIIRQSPQPRETPPKPAPAPTDPPPAPPKLPRPPYECGQCGAYILNTEVHRRWHEENARLDKETRRGLAGLLVDVEELQNALPTDGNPSPTTGDTTTTGDSNQ